MIQKRGKWFSEKHALGLDPGITRKGEGTRAVTVRRTSAPAAGLTALWVDSAAACGYAKAGASKQGERTARK
jgi:hypothetical protein